MATFRPHTAIVLLALLAGCAVQRPIVPAGEGKVAEEPFVDGLVIRVGSSPGIPGPSYAVQWAIRPDGECRGTVTTGSNTGNLPATTEELGLRSEKAYQECERLLRDTDFFRMRDRAPDLLFEAGCRWIEVRTGRRRHTVSIIGNEPAPAGFTRLNEFMTRLTERAREVKTKEPS
jgi:hypothetical protein